MRKCIMCYERVDEGKEPACVEACPTEALTFGYRDDLVVNGRAKVTELVEEGYTDAYLYGDEELGGTPLMEVLAYSKDVYDCPTLPLESQEPITWRDFTLPAGILGLAALAFGGITYIKNRGSKKEEETA
jgi:formate dehydrogenase iron-sulfur subunit